MKKVLLIVFVLMFSLLTLSACANNFDYETMLEKIAVLESELDDIKSNATNIDKITELESEIDNIKSELDDIKSNVATANSGLLEKITALESEIAELKAMYNAIYFWREIEPTSGLDFAVEQDFFQKIYDTYSTPRLLVDKYIKFALVVDEVSCNNSFSVTLSSEREYQREGYSNLYTVFYNVTVFDCVYDDFVQNYSVGDEVTIVAYCYNFKYLFSSQPYYYFYLDFTFGTIITEAE